MTEGASLKIKLTRTVRDFSGSPYSRGSVLRAWIARDGMLEVAGPGTCRSTPTNGTSC